MLIFGESLMSFEYNAVFLTYSTQSYYIQDVVIHFNLMNFSKINPNKKETIKSLMIWSDKYLF